MRREMRELGLPKQRVEAPSPLIVAPGRQAGDPLFQSNRGRPLPHVAPPSGEVPPFNAPGAKQMFAKHRAMDHIRQIVDSKKNAPDYRDVHRKYEDFFSKIHQALVDRQAEQADRYQKLSAEQRKAVDKAEGKFLIGALQIVQTKNKGYKGKMQALFRNTVDKHLPKRGRGRKKKAPKQEWAKGANWKKQMQDKDNEPIAKRLAAERETQTYKDQFAGGDYEFMTGKTFNITMPEKFTKLGWPHSKYSGRVNIISVDIRRSGNTFRGTISYTKPDSNTPNRVWDERVSDSSHDMFKIASGDDGNGKMVQVLEDAPADAAPEPPPEPQASPEPRAAPLPKKPSSKKRDEGDRIAQRRPKQAPA